MCWIGVRGLSAIEINQTKSMNGAMMRTIEDAIVSWDIPGLFRVADIWGLSYQKTLLP